MLHNRTFFQSTADCEIRPAPSGLRRTFESTLACTKLTVKVSWTRASLAPESLPNRIVRCLQIPTPCVVSERCRHLGICMETQYQPHYLKNKNVSRTFNKRVGYHSRTLSLLRASVMQIPKLSYHQANHYKDFRTVFHFSCLLIQPEYVSTGVPPLSALLRKVVLQLNRRAHDELKAKLERKMCLLTHLCQGSHNTLHVHHNNLQQPHCLVSRQV